MPESQNTQYHEQEIIDLPHQVDIQDLHAANG